MTPRQLLSSAPREAWASRTGFVLASIGAAAGIGNIWRFPYVVGSNGGAFLIPYVIAVALLGLPLMIVEFALGRRFRISVVPAFEAIGTRFRFVGLWLVAVLTTILAYYLVVTGWVLAYVLAFVANTRLPFGEFRSSYWPLGVFLLAAGLCFLVVRAGVHYYLTPDLSRLTDPLVWTAPFGQASFALGVGSGIMLTYASYAGDNALVKSAGLTTVADLLVALVGSLVIFPVVFSFAGDPAGGVQLAFVTLPRIFQDVAFWRFFGGASFLLLFIAALTSAVSILEVPVATFVDAYGVGRRRATAIASAAVTLIGLPSALSYTALKVELLGTPLLDLKDFVSGTVGLMAAGLMMSVAAGWIAAPHLRHAAGVGRRGQRVFMVLVRFVIPAVLALALAMRAFRGM